MFFFSLLKTNIKKSYFSLLFKEIKKHTAEMDSLLFSFIFQEMIKIFYSVKTLKQNNLFHYCIIILYDSKFLFFFKNYLTLYLGEIDKKWIIHRLMK